MFKRFFEKRRRAAKKGRIRAAIFKHYRLVPGEHGVYLDDVWKKVNDELGEHEVITTSNRLGSFMREMKFQIGARDSQGYQVLDLKPIVN